ncbi:TetR family transcriptional regulator [Streptomyces sp. NPDC088106]|uniref:TetR family transcriptional regulator n=1 Tax=unclassified Streptomyces TaxID=2593676 RepID=UPI003447BA97
MTGQVRTVDGRVAGRRGQATRQKLLDCLSEMLSSSPYRDVKVIDVARRAGTSPATFYQYFPDVEGAVLELAEEMAAESGGLTDLVAGRSWAGRGGWQTAQELVDGFLEFWRKHDAILRVVDLGAAEGDKRFYKIRMKVLNAVNTSLADSVAELQAKGRIDKDVNPGAVAGSLVAMLAAVASHQKGFSSWGVKQAEIKPNLALLVHLGVTGRKPTR